MLPRTIESGGQWSLTKAPKMSPSRRRINSRKPTRESS
jgi:hypothetical protein